jgi:excisionase family DNA binding protein
MVSLLNLKEAASYLRVHRETLRKWVVAGKVPCARLGNRYRFVQDDLDKWVRNQYTDTSTQSEKFAKWSINVGTVPIGGLGSRPQAGSLYDALVRRQTGGPLPPSNLSSGLTPGTKAS